MWVPEAPMVNLRRYTELDALGAPAMGVAAYVTCELIHARTGLIAGRLDFKNLIVDKGLDLLFGMAVRDRLVESIISHCAVGTGSAPPTVSDSALSNEVGRTNSNGGFSVTYGTAAGNEYMYARKTFVFTQAQANGNLTDIALFTAGNVMWMHALLKDANGLPTTIVKNTEYELRVIYELRFYPNLADVVYSALLNGVATNVTCRPSGLSWNVTENLFLLNSVQVYSGGLGSVTSAPTGDITGGSPPVTPAAYVAGTFARDAVVTLSAAQGNGTIRSFRTGGYLAPFFQHEVAAPFLKANTQKLVINVRTSAVRL